MMTLGKQVTLPKGAIVVDRGPAVVNGRPDARVRMCERRDGDGHEMVLAKVVEALPVTLNRDSFGWRPGV
jgi:hypothetical protein